MTIRLSTSSLAGTARTLVAVGTVSEAFMFFTTLAAAPRSGVRFGPPSAVAPLPGLGAALAGVAGWWLGARSAARLTTVPSDRGSVLVVRDGCVVVPWAAAGAAGFGAGCAAFLAPVVASGEAASREGAGAAWLVRGGTTVGVGEEAWPVEPCPVVACPVVACP